MTEDSVPFDALTMADLVVDRVYRGGTVGTSADDPINRLAPGVGNQGGFRPRGSVDKGNVSLVVLYTSGEHPDWPDVLDPYTGLFSYWGDNRTPGKIITNTPRRGNLLLEKIFADAADVVGRATVPPVLLFSKVGTGRDVRFRGLLAPGNPSLAAADQLAAVWRSTGGQRFQNYHAQFTVLDVPVVSRAWLTEIVGSADDGQPATAVATYAPPAWTMWVKTGTYKPLVAPPTLTIRTEKDQSPTSPADVRLVQTVHQHFAKHPVGFEHFAAELWRAQEPSTQQVDVTRPWRDGGRDAVGTFRIGPDTDPVLVEFALEAKCYGPGNSVGVKEVSRLISRLRYRQFGVLITTSYLHGQAYKEIRDDGHPVVVISARDVVALLHRMNLADPVKLSTYLDSLYPDGQAAITPSV